MTADWLLCSHKSAPAVITCQHERIYKSEGENIELYYDYFIGPVHVFSKSQGQHSWYTLFVHRSARPKHCLCRHGNRVTWAADFIHSPYYNLTLDPVKLCSCGLIQPLHCASWHQFIAAFVVLCRFLQVTGLQTLRQRPCGPLSPSWPPSHS